MKLKKTYKKETYEPWENLWKLKEKYEPWENLWKLKETYEPWENLSNWRKLMKLKKLKRTSKEYEG